MTTGNVSLIIPEDFNKWFAKARKYWGVPSLSVIGPAILFIINSSVNSGRAVPEFPLSVALLGFQVVVITVLLVAIPPPNSNDKIAPQASAAIEQFYEAWKRLWLFWLFLYLGLTAQEVWRIYLEKVQFKDNREALEAFFDTNWRWSLGLVGENLLNNLQTLALVMCYLVVARKTVPEGRERATLPWLQGAGILLTITAAELFLRFAWFPIFGTRLADVPELFRWLGGCGAGVAIALLLGRLDSKAINLPIWIVCLIYLYAVIQPGWAAFPKQPNAKVILVVLALVLKTLMFLLVAWLFKSGVLLFYLERLRAMDQKIKKERHTFLVKLEAQNTKDDRTKATEDSPNIDKSVGMS